MKQFIYTGMLVLSIFLLAGYSDGERSFSIDEVNIDAQINEDGTIEVREQFTYTFNGSFEGVTRSIHSDSQHFLAFLLEDDVSAQETNDLEPLKVEEEDDTYRIFTGSADETKTVLYTYTIEGSVNKYTDVAELEYAFFDDSNETDLNNVQIIVHPPNQTMQDTHFFLHEDPSGNLNRSDNGLVYTNSLLEAGETSMLRFLFPADQLTGMEFTKDSPMLANILAEEKDFAERLGNLDANMGKAVPIIWGLIGAVVLTTILVFFLHPNRYRGNKSEDALIQVLEQTDPLFVKYLRNSSHLSYDSFIAGLFSLKQRGIVSLKEVPSLIKEGDRTFRFTWVSENETVDMADTFLRSWLFTKSDKLGDYFLLEDLLDNKGETDEVKKKKAEQFEMDFYKWAGLVIGREGYQGLRHKWKGYSFLSIPLLIISFVLYNYFVTIDTISQTAQWVLPVIVGLLTVVTLLFNRNKWVNIAYYFIVLLMTLIGFSLTPAVILASVFYFITFVSLLIIPNYYWEKEIKEINYATFKGYWLFIRNRYPTGSEPSKLERRLEYAIVLGAGEKYGKQCGKAELAVEWNAIYPLLHNPVYATTSFSPSNLILYTVVLHSTTSTSTSSPSSSTGGGGAGAF
ncbi:DUF2207 domain-containing protein [Oceanobacillus polygoni]|uniref:Membrane protein n=1 Tax=Oceanobacillus polygoni TaxID=1235259 RepID=A0A9X1CG58_9BACI|nr:DUF2207 domain-containing protein [Oceanobacillus polygoni]MBP2078085.1 putative membrane protein [Oceanobacillus polygoni]